MFGFLNVFKPAGPTSHDVVAGVRRLVGRKVRVGHAGTLDPFAEGVLVICVGPATRLASYVQAATKRYIAEVTLGATSTTDDVEGQITPQPSADAPHERQVREVLARFVGETRQAPPAHSAVHVDGQRAYRLARAGHDVRPASRTVTIHEIGLLRCEYPLLTIDVRCGGGTYIRALARDIGAAMGVGGYCSKLTRTQVGPFGAGEAVPPDRLDPPRNLLDPLVALETLAKVTVDDEAARKLATGQRIRLDAPAPPGEIAVVNAAGRLLAIAAAADDGRSLRPSRVFPQK